MKQKVKVIELVGQKLDPKAKYIFIVHEAAMTRQTVQDLGIELYTLLGDNFVIAQTALPLEQTLKVFEVLPTKAKGDK